MSDFHFPAAPPLGLYVHIPWCLRKCPYCDFNSHAAPDSIPERAYVDALLADLDATLVEHARALTGRRLRSLFIGGGTPSLFSAEALDQLFGGLRARLPWADDIEITLEANPGTIEAGRFAEYRAAGINRLSIGVQSFHPDSLQRLGRVHSAREAIRAAEQAHAAGLDNFNLDLMFGLPGQDLAMGLADLATAIDLEPAHISWYQLTLEPNTLFAARPPSLPAEEQIWHLQQQGEQRLAAAGYTQYEVSAHARSAGGPARPCRHNLNYWRFGDYLGIGAGAHAKLTDVTTGGILRQARRRHPQDYLRLAGRPDCISEQHWLDAADAVFEYALNAFRLRQGFRREDFQLASGRPIIELDPGLACARERGLLGEDGDRLYANTRGWAFLNDLVGCFLPCGD